MSFKKIDFNGRKFEILKVNINSNSNMIKKAEDQAKLKAKFVSKFDPANRLREEKEIINKNFLGVLADIICADILNKYFKKHSKGLINVERYDDVRNDEFKDHDLYDLRVFNDFQERIVEVRSSLCLHLSVKNMINKWQILGPYSSNVKGDTETKKPFYMRLLYKYNLNGENLNEINYIDSMKNGLIDIYYVGGATLEQLEIFGREDNGSELKQGDAKYLVLDILDGLDAQKFLKTILYDFSKDE